MGQKLAQSHIPSSLRNTNFGQEAKQGQHFPLNLNVKKEKELTNGFGDCGEYSFGEDGYRSKNDGDRSEDGRHTVGRFLIFPFVLSASLLCVVLLWL